MMHSFLFFLSVITIFHSNLVNSVVLKASSTLRSQQNAEVSVRLDTDADEATITMTVDSNRYLGVGFGSTSMSNTYAIIAYGTTNVMERKLGNRAQGTQLTDTVSVQSDSASDSIRTLVVTRTLTGADSNYYDFSGISEGSSISIIYGIGSGTSWSQHAFRGDKTLTFIGPTSAPTVMPTVVPTDPSEMPTMLPSTEPTTMPSSNPTIMPSSEPTSMPSEPSLQPTMMPTPNSTTSNPTFQPTEPSVVPTAIPSLIPSNNPSAIPSSMPSMMPSAMPTDAVTALVSINYASDEGATYDLENTIILYEDSTLSLSMSGPSGQWIGFGFGSLLMENTYAIIIDGNGNISERRLANQNEGTELPSSNYTTVMNSAENGVRSVEIMFDLKENSRILEYFNFTQLASETSFDYMMASSMEVELSYHDWKQFGTVSLSSEDDDATTPTPDSGDTDTTPADDGNSAMKIAGFDVLGVVVSCLLVFLVLE